MTDGRIAGLERLLANVPAHCSAVDDGVWRCERRYQDGDPFAVVFLDLRGRLPETPNALLGIEEKYVARGFFEGPKHLKWNHYFLFVVPDSKWKDVSGSEARQWIERDTTYAKKVVVPDAGVKTFFQEQKWDVGADQELKAPREVWLKSLAANGLDRLLFSRHRAPAVKKWIHTGEIDATLPASVETKQVHDDTGGLSEIKWTKFRQWPTLKHFAFSQVNLIEGVNGVGKTSLLEAIEMFYCGETHRSSSGPVVNDVLGKFERQTQFRKLPAAPADKRERDLRWFGAYWRQKQELAKSFNRYIFFNSDAAFQLQQSAESQQVTTALMNVALGEDATVLWGRIREYREEIEGQLAELTSNSKLHRTDRDVAKRELGRLTGIPMLAEKSLGVLQAQLRSLKWLRNPSDIAEFENQFWPKIVEVHEFAHAFEHLPKGVESAKQVEELLAALKKRKTRIQGLIRQTDTEHKKLEDLQAARKRLSPKYEALRKLRDYVSVGWVGIWCRLKEDSETSEQMLAVRKHTRALNYDVLSSLDLQRSVATLQRENANAMDAIARELAKNKKKLDQLRERISEFESILSEARALGQRLTKAKPDADECPLCGHVHQPGELKHRIERRRTSGQREDDAFTELAEQTATLEKQSRRLVAIDKSLTTLSGVVESLRIATGAKQNESLASLLSRLKNLDGAFDEITERIRATTNALRDLQNKGFDEADFRGSYDEVFRGQIKENSGWAETFKDRVKDEHDSLSKDLASRNTAIRSSEQKVVSLERETSELLAGYGSGDDYEKRELMLDGDIVRLEDARQTAAMLRKECDLAATSDLRTLSKSLERVHSISKDLATTISEEKARRLTISSLERRLRDKDAILLEMQPRLRRAEEGAALFGKVMKEHSIESLLAQFINENHERITSILIDLHAPKEFIGIEKWDGPGGIRLIRNDRENTRADLTQVSTGQRSAIALAIYLTLNEKLKSAPPLIMLDDPIAHVDDLNMLAFIDYLREIAITRTRQIFFASANDKVASIFQQKFLPLGNDFRSISLAR